METRRMEYFLKVAETLNFSEAAKTLYISHQALSKQIQLLEEDLNISLFERTTTKVLLTETGQKLYELYKPISIQIEKFDHDIREFIKNKKDTLRIGYFNGLPQNQIVTKVVQFFLKNDPSIRIEMLATDVKLIKTLFMKDNIDLAITVTHKYNNWDVLPFITIASCRSKIIVSKQHPWFKKECVTVEDIQDADLLIYREDIRENENHYFGDAKIRNRFCVPNVDTYMGMLELGHYFGVVSDFFRVEEKSNFRLIDLPKVYDFETRVICAYKENHSLSDIFEKIKTLQIKL